MLYCFVVNRDVVYLGKTNQGLNRRFAGYKKPGPTQKTNIANHQNIMSLLDDEIEVDIYVFEPSDATKIGVFNLNIAAGLEDDIIKKICPNWNCPSSNKMEQVSL